MKAAYVLGGVNPQTLTIPQIDPIGGLLRILTAHIKKGYLEMSP